MFKELDDIKAEEEYKKIMGLNCVHITQKQRKINYLVSKYRWDEKELNKLKSKQLGAIIYKNK
jgi:hypothetical protein